MADSTISFEIRLRTAGTGQLPAARIIDRFRPDPEALELCRGWLHAHGGVAHSTGFSLACSIAPEAFELLFGVRVRAVKRGAGPSAWRVEGAIRVPEEIAAFVEEVTLPPPPEFFSDPSA